MAVFSYVGGSVSMATGSYGNLAIRKGAQVAAPNTITTSLRSFTEGTPASGLFDPVDRSLQYSKIAHGSGYNATKINFNTTEPYNSGAYSTSSYYTPYTTVFQDLDYSQYNTQSPSGEYWAHAQGYLNSEFGTAIAVDKNRNAWVTGSTDYCSCTVTSIAASLTPAVSFPSNSTTPTAGTNDSGYFLLTSPFNHNIFGLTGVDTALVVQTNSWLGFQPLINNTATALTATTPAWANIQIGAGQASCQRVYFGTFGTAPNRTYRIRFEGTNATTGTLGSPNMVWEFILYESTPNIFDIQIGTWTPPASSSYGITDGTTYFGSNVFSNTVVPAANTGWRFTTGNVTAGSSGNNITLVKYSNKGKFHQNKDFFPYDANDDLVVLSIGRNGSDVGESIKIGSDGRIYILYTSNSQGYVSGVANNDLGVIKIDPDYLYKVAAVSNATVWNKSFGTTSGDSAQSFDIDANDNLYITGFTAGSGQGGNDVIVIKVDKLGNVIWKKTYGASTGGDLGNSIKITPDGNHLYIWGYSGSTPLVGTSSDWFLLKINSSDGVIVWQKHFNIGATTQGQVFENSIDVDPDGNVYVNGFAASSPQSYFVAKLDSSGNFKWSRNVGALTSNPDAGTSIKYKKGFLYIGGQDSSTINNSEGFGLGVSKLDANTGQLISNYVVGGINTEYAFALEVDDYNDIYATGITNTSLPGLTSASGVNALTTKFILDTPQGGFTISGNAGVWSSTTGIKRYTSRKEYFDAQSIVFQNDLLLTGHQSIFGIGAESQSAFSFEKEFKFSGSGSLPALTSTLEQIPLTTTQYLQRTNVLSDATEYTRVNISSLLQVSGIPNPISGVVDSPTAIYNAVASSNGGAPAFLAGYITPVTSTGTFAAGTVSILSIFAKTNTWNKFSLLAYSSVFGSSGALPNHEVIFDLNAGTSTLQSTTNAPLDYGIIPYSNGWYRCWFKVQSRVSSNQSGGAGWFQIRFSSDSVAGSSIYWYGPQLQKDTLTTYVENTSSVSSLTTTAYIEDNNVNTESTFGTPITAPSTQLFTLSGTPTITYKNALNKPVQTYRGSSDLSLLNGYEVVFDPDLYTGKVQYRVYDSILYSTEKFEKEFTFAGSGFIASSGINVIADVTFNGGVGAPGTQLFTIGSGYTSVKSIDAWSTQDPKVITVSGSVSVKAPNRHIGASPVEYYPPSQVVLGNEENFRASEFKSDSTAFYRFQKGAFSATGSIASGDQALKSTTNVAFIPLNTLLLFNTNVFTKIAMQYAGKSPTTPFGGLDIIFEELEANAPPQQFKYSGAASEPTKAFKWIGGPQQVSSITGTAVEKNTEAYAVSGQLTTGLEASAKVIFRPFDATDSEQLFSINGQHGTRVFVPNWIPTGRFVSQSGVNEAILKKSSAWVGSSPIQYFDPQEVIFEDGENFRASEFKYESTALYRFQKGTFSGTGSIVGDPNATAAVVFNPPDTAAGIQLFSISGEYSNLRFTKKSSEAAGTISITGAATPPLSRYSWVGSSPIEYYNAGQIVFGEGENFRASEFKYDSTSLYRFQNGNFSGSGTIVGDPNASAAVVFNPPDTAAGIQLFNVTGAYSDLRSISRNVITSAPLFAGASGSAAVVFNPPDTSAETQLFTVAGSLVEKYTKGLYTGDGYINSSDFGSAKVTFRPFDATDSDPLFSINGQHGTRVFVPNWITTGRFISQAGVNEAILKKSSAWVGSSPIEYYSAGQIVFGEGENFYASEFKYDSTALYRFQNASFNGSGSITTDPNASAAVVFNPPDEAAGVQLFNVTGAYSDLRFIKKVPADAVLLTVVISGAASQPTTNYSWVGSSPTAYFNPDDIVFGEDEDGIPTEYRNISTANYRNQFVESGSGLLPSISGSAEEIYKAGPFVAGGQITISGGATNIQFIIQADETPVLFQISGAATQIKSGYAWVGLSPFTYFSAGQIVFEEGENFGASEFKYDSTAAYRFQNATFSGSGSITTDPNASASVSYNPPDEAAAVQLFTVSGQHGTRVFVPNWIATGSTTTSGSGSQSIQYANFTGNSPSAYIDPYEVVFGEEENYGSTDISLSGYSRFNTTPKGEVGSGALFSDGFFSNLKVTFRPFDATDSEQLFSINGQHGTKVFVPNWNVTGSITTDNSGTYNTTSRWIGSSPIQYFDPQEIIFEDGENFYASEFKYDSTALYRFQNATFNGTGSIASSDLGSAKVTFRPVDATDTDFLFSISGSAGVKLRDYVWVSAVVEYDPYEYVINDEFIIPDFIKIKTTFEWDNTNNIYRSLTKESITKDFGSGFVGASLVDQDIQGFLNASVPTGVGLDIALETVTGSGSGATVSYFSSNNQIAFIEIATSAGSGYIQGDVLRLPVGSNPTITLGSLVNATVFGSAIIQGNVGSRTFVPNWRGSGFITITGTATEKHIDAASGSGSLFAASGASQSVGANPPDDTVLFVISNSATEKHIDIASGSGSATFTGTAIESHTDVTAGSGEAVFGDGSATAQIISYNVFGGLISISQNATASVTFNPPESDPLFNLSGSATESQTDITSGSGSIATDISAVSRVVFNPADTEQLFEVTGAYSNLKFTSDYNATGIISVTGTVVEKHIDIATGSGTSTFTGAATESQTDIAVPGTGTIEIGGASVDEYASGGLRGSGTLFIIDGGSARVAFNPPEGNQLFDVSGSFSNIKITSDYNGSGSITIEGNVGSRVFVPNWIGSGTITVTGESTQKHVDITSGSGALFTDGFFSNLKATFRSVSDVGLFDVTGTAAESQRNITSGSGSATFAGAATESQTEITSGSGTLFSGGLYSNLRVTFNPTEDPALFDITGFATDKQTYKETGSGSVTLTGTLVEKHIDAATGSGSIATGFNASASVTFRPFDATDTDSLFSILGSAIEKNTESYVGSGDATFSGTAAESQRNITSGSGALFTDGFFSNLKATFRPFDATDLDPLFSINGSAVEKNTESYVATGSTIISGFIVEKHIEVASGSGSLFAASGAAEAFGANPPEDTSLFTIDGAATQKYFVTNIGSGSIVTSFSGTASVTFNPPEDTQLFSVSGTYSNLKFISANVVSGSATFSGTVVEKFTSANNVSGTTTFTGTAVEKQTDITFGSGSLFTASGASESVGANPPEDTALFSVSGTYSNLKFTSDWVGSGTLFAVSGVAESVTFNPPEDTQLFVVSGAVSQSQTNITLPGSGSLFTAFGGTASVTFNPPEDTQLFSVSGAYNDLKFISVNVASGTATFSGTVIQKFTTVNIVSGTATFDGTAVEKQTDITSGSGSLFAASGAAEAFGANPPEDTALFDISGTYSDLKSTSVYVGSGSLFTFSGAVVVATISEIGTGLFDIGDTAIDSTTYKTIDGTGSLFGFGGGVESVTFDPVENTQLFQVSGEVYVTTSFGYGGGELALTGSGQAIFRRALVPQFGSGEILSSGESANKKIFAPFVGSGSLFAASGSAQATTNVPPIDPVIWEDDLRTTLYLASGSASVSRTASIDNDVNLNISGSGVARTVLPERIFATII